MSDDTSHPPFRGRNDFRRRRSCAQQGEQMAGRAAARQRGIPARAHGREVIGVSARRAVPNPVDTAVFDVERAVVNPRPDLLRADLGSKQLPPLHNPVRGERQRPKNLLNRPVPVLHTNT